MTAVSITEASIREMVDKFYARVREDPVLSPIFESQLAGKWDQHMPRMYAFWTKVLLGTGEFQANVFGKHMALNGIGKDHFVRWLALFKMTAIGVFGIEDAAAPIEVADRIASSLQLGFFGEIHV
jgi:truncated hemoglobin YjbI